MKHIIHDLSLEIERALLSIDPQKAELRLVTQIDMPAIVVFYCASHAVGKDILTYENETIELVLLSKRVSSGIVTKATQAKTVIANMSETLTVPQYFATAVDVLNDDDVNTSLFDFKYPEKIIWALILLMAVYSASNIPIRGEALRFVIACLKQEGWTMPPFLLGTQKFTDFFEYFDQQYYDNMQCSEKEMLLQCAVDSEGYEDAEKNFRELHKPIFQYINAKTKELKKEIEALV